MVDRMRADGNQGIGCERSQFVPGHAQVFAEGGDVDLITPAQVANDTADFFFGWQTPQPSIKQSIECTLFSNRAAVEALVLAVEHKPDAVVPGDHRLKRQPPQFPQAVGKAGRNIKPERDLVFFQDRIGELQIVAIPVVEGQANETALGIALDQALVHFIESDNIKPRAAQLAA